MPTISVSTDTSLTFDPDSSVVNIQISEKDGNVLHVNNNNQLYTEDISMFSGNWYPMNGINGRAGVPIGRIECNSSVSRLCHYNDMESDGVTRVGEIFHDGVSIAPETPDMDGVDLIKLFKAILPSFVEPVWFTDTHYASYSTPTG